MTCEGRDPASGDSTSRTLPPLLRPGLRFVFIGYNPGLESARQGHYYAFRGNAFWRHLSASGLVPREVTYEDDRALMDLASIGFTDLCTRATLRASELLPEEQHEGAHRLLAELEHCAPRVAIFGGKQLFALFAMHALGLPPVTLATRPWGPQPETLAGGSTATWVIPSSSGLASKWHAERLRLLRELAAVHREPEYE